MVKQKVYDIFRGVMTVEGFIHPEKTFTWKVNVPIETSVSSSKLRYTVSPNQVATAAVFEVYLNGTSMSQENWNIFTQVQPRSKEIDANLIPGENTVMIRWALSTIYSTTNFDTYVALTIEYEGPDIQVPPSFEDYLYYGIALGAVAVVGVLVIKFVQARKKG